MSKKDEALKMAIEFIEKYSDNVAHTWPFYVGKSITNRRELVDVLKAALSEPAQDNETAIGVVSFSNHSRYVGYHTIKVLPDGNYHVYTSPPKQDSGEAVAILHRKTLEVYSPKLTVHHKADITFIKQNESDIDSDMKYMLLADGDYNLYTSPPKREWRGLSESEIYELLGSGYVPIAKAIEAKLKELNHD